MVNDYPLKRVIDIHDTSQYARLTNNAGIKKNTIVGETFKLLCDVFNGPLTIPKVKGRLARKATERVPINAKDERGRTLLILACINNKQDLVCFLLENYGQEISVGESDKEGNTSLHYACFGGRQSLIAKLTSEMVKRGIDIKTKNQEGLTAVEMALKNNNICAAEVVVRELHANFVDAANVEDLVCQHKSRFPNLFITGEQESLKEWSSDGNHTQTIGLPSISRAKSHPSCRETTRHSTMLTPRCDTRRSSKSMCSHLFALRSMQDTAAYRQGFPLVKDAEKHDLSARESCSTSYRTASPLASQTGIESRRGSSRKRATTMNIKPGSACHSLKALRTKKSHSIPKVNYK